MADPSDPQGEGVPVEAANAGPVPSSPELVLDSVIARPLQEAMHAAGPEPIGVVAELRNSYPGGIAGAGARVSDLIAEIAPDADPRLTGSYLVVALTPEQIRQLVQRDIQPAASFAGGSGPEGADGGPGPEGVDGGPGPEGADGGPGPAGGPGTAGPSPRAAIHRLWPNFETGALIHRTIVTTKCQAVHRAFDGLGQDVVWAVLDSGIDADHRHFEKFANLELPAHLRHRSFVGDDDGEATRDAAGHGTHVAGILAGAQVVPDDEDEFVAATWYQDDRGDAVTSRLPLRAITGMAPRCKLLSCKVLRDDRTGDMAGLLAALQYIQELNDEGRDIQVHGVNLSVGYPFDPSWFAAGLTPVCKEVDRLVRTGVVVVAAAGNTGFGYALGPDGNRIRMGFDLSINDPGNAEQAITVGATSARPHATGVSYFSSKGPTGDGRMKPDLIAPGERIVSAGAGAALEKARASVPDATYVEDSGTSMAAPHVSGVAAAVLSVHREFIGRPEQIKRILLGSATDLGRAREFQGHGLVDAMRAIQAV